MSGGLQTIVVKFLGDVAGLAEGAELAKKSLEGVSADAEKSSSGFDKFSKASLIAGGAIAGVLVEGIKSGIENMSELDDSNVALQSVLNNMPNKLGLTTEALDKQADALQGTTTFTRDQILAADQLLLKNTGVTTAIKNGITTQAQATQTVLDFAQATGTDASTAAAKYAKILDNPFAATKALASAGVVLTAQQTAQIAAYKKSGDTVAAQAILQQALTDKLKGTAAAAGDTLPAKLQQAKEAFGDAEGELTVALIPALNTLVGWLKKVADWAQANPAQFKVVVGILAGLATVLIAIGVATKLWSAYNAVATAVQWAFNTSLLGCPVVWLILGFAAIVAAIVVLVKNWGTVKAAFVDTFNWLKSNWPLLLAIITGPIGLAVLAIVKNWDSIKKGAQDVWNGIKSVFSSVGSFFAGVGDGIANGIKGGINAAIDVVNDFIKGVNSADAISVFGHRLGAPTIPLIPHFAAGGVMGQTGMAWVGENGPELVTLPGGSKVTPNSQLGNHRQASTSVQVFSGGQDITQFVTKIVSKNTRATRNAVVAGGSRAFV